MLYTVDANADVPIMLLNTHIGFDEVDGQGIDGSLFQQELLQLDSLGKKSIAIWINSPGGDVMQGYSIFNAILKSKTPVDTFCVGAAASMAAVIFQAGRKRIMADYAWLMYHNPFGSDDKTMIQTMTDSLVTMVASKSGMTNDQVAKMFDRTSYIQPIEALNMGLCDQIEPSVNLNTKYLKTITNQLSFRRECNKVVNKILNKQNTFSMEKITMRLKLNDAATQDNIIKAIDAIEDRAIKAETDLSAFNKKAKDEKKELEDKMKDMEDKMADHAKKMDDMKAEYKDCKDELDAMTKDKKKAEDDAEEDKIKNLVDEKAKEGRIKNEETVKLQWRVIAKKVGLEEVKNMLEALPLSKTAPKVIVTNKLEEGELPTTAMSLAVKNKLKREGKN